MSYIPLKVKIMKYVKSNLEKSSGERQGIVY